MTGYLTDPSRRGPNESHWDPQKNPENGVQEDLIGLKNSFYGFWENILG